MSNHIKGNWFIPVRDLIRMSYDSLVKISLDMNYRESTRRNAGDLANEILLNRTY